MTDYIPEVQDIVWMDFDPALGHEIKKRRPALVLSHSGYSKLTNLVVVCPITHAANNAIRSAGFMIPISNDIDEIDGFINPLQFQTLDFNKRHIKYITSLDTPTYLNVRKKVLFVIG
ncbi:type II toxin-antitoxin system PemK/MazF family toxin [Levilactobacillus mulengensis]|uniref:type II toxin-antitoxin system PemK/MazF family toxin n=1 Tax=Levilactobacillus mulengensis TaxID=2486025 RepID=UPI000F7AA4B0|nr:type II toxin-antitoxin system PemK/MazF family toxin [Levilactobacillus mulengensis]